MRVQRWSLLVALALLVLGATAAYAGECQPIQVSLFNPVQLFPEKTSVSGLRLNLIYGVNDKVTGLDWGLINQAHGDEFGVAGGRDRLRREELHRLAGQLRQRHQGEFTGFQSGLYNTCDQGNGVQFGVVNNAKAMHGLQLGILNMTETLHGLQIGVGNVIQKGKTPFLPIVNWSH